MTPKTLQLALYKNCDPDQPVTFTGSDRDIVLSKLRAWMTANNGEGGKPDRVDGLTLTVREEEAYEIVLRTRRGFAIDWGMENASCHFYKWSTAQTAFTDACSYEIWPEGQDDRDSND